MAEPTPMSLEILLLTVTVLLVESMLKTTVLAGMFVPVKCMLTNKSLTVPNFNI